jgi:DNA topoisomerase-3
MKTLIITEKSSQAKDLRAALGDRFGQILPAEGHLLRLAEPEEVNAEWKRWSCTLLKPDGLYPTRPAGDRNKPSKLKAIAMALLPDHTPLASRPVAIVEPHSRPAHG